MRTEIKTIYQYDELPTERAKERAREWLAGLTFSDSNDWEHVYTDAEQVADLLGITIHSRSFKTVGGGSGSEPCIWFSGFSSQGDGACFEGVYQYAKGAPAAVAAYAPKDAELLRIAKGLQDVQRRNFYRLRATCRQSGHYYHSGCMSVSVEDHGYMYRDMERYGKNPHDVRRSAAATFFAPLKWKEPAMVFTCSWSDVFIGQADPWREQAWDVIRLTPHLTYQILTKRPERINLCLPLDWGDGWDNVWLGTSVENDDYRRRINALVRAAPAPVHFVSAEPLLGELDLSPWLVGGSIGWVIVGGESGPDARPMNLDWARRIRDDCAEYDVPFFYKQTGGNKKIDGVWGGDLLDGIRHYNWPATK